MDLATLPNAQPAPAERGRPLPGWLIDMYAAVDVFDLNTFLTFVSPDCAFYFANAEPIYGHEAIRAALSGLFAALKAISHHDLEAWVTPDATICSGRVTYTRPDDSQLTVPFAVIFKLDHQLVYDYRIFVDNSQLF